MTAPAHASLRHGSHADPRQVFPPDGYVGSHRGPADSMGDARWVRERILAHVFWFKRDTAHCRQQARGDCAAAVDGFCIGGTHRGRCHG